ncbi:DUF4825 domain-containing protein [Paenibacillus shunpengii]|uniref:DUF4825 domain-containing protein n=1 Tax=Paenibacillus shunpengii TaxID=2054424 RepID=A0ABW5SM53_9BACL
MREKIKLFMSLLFAVFLLSGCNSYSNDNDVDLFQYKGSYVGDNSAVFNSVINIEGAKHLSGLELKTKEKPYGIIVNYDWSDSELNGKKTAINNASYLFVLLQNVEWINFNFERGDGIEEYKITRDNLQTWYGRNLDMIDKEDQLKVLITESLEDEEKVNQLRTKG